MAQGKVWSHVVAEHYSELQEWPWRLIISCRRCSSSSGSKNSSSGHRVNHRRNSIVQNRSAVTVLALWASFHRVCEHGAHAPHPLPPARGFHDQVCQLFAPPTKGFGIAVEERCAPRLLQSHEERSTPASYAANVAFCVQFEPTCLPVMMLSGPA